MHAFVLGWHSHVVLNLQLLAIGIRKNITFSRAWGSRMQGFSVPVVCLPRGACQTLVFCACDFRILKWFFDFWISEYRDLAALGRQSCGCEPCEGAGLSCQPGLSPGLQLQNVGKLRNIWSSGFHFPGEFVSLQTNLTKSRVFV